MMADNVDPLLGEALEQLVLAHGSRAIVRAIEQGESPAPLWNALHESGFPDALRPESRNGAGLSLHAAFALFELCGRHALPVPLAETMVARALIDDAAGEVPEGSIALALDFGPHGGGHRGMAAHGMVCDHVLACHDGHLVLLQAASATRSAQPFPLDARLDWPPDALRNAPVLGPSRHLRELQALVLSCAIAGAANRAFDMSVQHANERMQFGRPIGKFQAVQHQLSVMAEQVCAVRMAAQIACQGSPTHPELCAIAVAKARASEAATEVAGLAHAIHGAIGFTAEFDLQLFTRRLHAWRSAAGAEGYWWDRLGDHLLNAGASALDAARALAPPDPMETR